MTFWRDWLSWLLIAVAIGCFVAGGFPHWTETVDPATGDRVKELRVGLWFSPVYQHIQRDIERSRTWRDERGFGESGQVGFETHSTIIWVSWSSLALVLGLGGLVFLQRRRSALGGQHVQQSEVQAKP
jgi:hypothetical protein